MNLDKIKHALTKEFYGLPVWAWGLIAVGGVGLGWYLTKNAGNLFGGLTSGQGSGATAGTGTPPAPTAPTSTTTTTTTTTAPPPAETANPIVNTGSDGSGGYSGPLPVSPTNPIQPVASQPAGGLPPTILSSLEKGTSVYRAPFNPTVESSGRTAPTRNVASIASRVFLNQNTVVPRASNQPYQSVVGRARAV